MKVNGLKLVGVFFFSIIATHLFAQQDKKLGELIPISGNYEYALIRDKKENKAKSGTLVANTWVRRDFNELTVLGKTDTWIKLNNSRITLQPGVYRIQGRVGAYRTYSTRIRLIEVNASGGLIEDNAHYGMSTHNHGNGYASVHPSILVYLKIDKETTFEIHHIANVASGGDEGRGMASSSSNSNDKGDETYAQVEVIRFSTP